ncbi:MAG: hypothetical protein QW450_03145 [Candidatus Nitrosocaldus sp.]
MWSKIIYEVLRLPMHKDMVVEKGSVVHPTVVGFKRSIGEPHGQSADYRLRLYDGKSIHVREYNNHYKVHWDRVDPSVSIIGHLKHDAPHIYILLLSILGISTGITIRNILTRKA